MGAKITWSDEMIEILKARYHIYGVKLANQLGVSMSSVRRKAIQLNLTSPDHTEEAKQRRKEKREKEEQEYVRESYMGSPTDAHWQSFCFPKNVCLDNN